MANKQAFVEFVVRKTLDYFTQAASRSKPVVSIDQSMFERGGWRAAIATLPQKNGCFTEAFSQHLLTRLGDSTTSSLFQEDRTPESQQMFQEWVLNEFREVHHPNSPAVKEHLTSLMSSETARKVLQQLEADRNSTRAILALYSVGGIFSDTLLIQFLINNCEDCVTAEEVQVQARFSDNEDVDDDALAGDCGSPVAPLRTYSDLIEFFSNIMPTFASRVSEKAANRVLYMNLDEPRTLTRVLRIACKGVRSEQQLLWLQLTAQKQILRSLKNSMDAFMFKGKNLDFVEKTMAHVDGYGKR